MNKKKILGVIIGTVVLALLVSVQLDSHITAGEDDMIDWPIYQTRIYNKSIL